MFEAMLANRSTYLRGRQFAAIYPHDGEASSALLPKPIDSRRKLTSNASERDPVEPTRGTDLATGRVAEHRRTIHVADLRVADRARYLRPGAMSSAASGRMLGVPMLREGYDLSALMALLRTEAQPFTNKQIELVENFAAQAVIAIENARLLNELRQRTDDLSQSLEQQTAITEVLQVISSSPGDLEPVFEPCCERDAALRGQIRHPRYRSEGDTLRTAADGAPQSFCEERRRNPIIRPRPGSQPHFRTQSTSDQAARSRSPTSLPRRA